VQQASSKAGELAEWLEQRDPGTLLDEVRGLARRKPGTFLLGALAAGVVAGRLTRGAVDASKDQDVNGSGATTPASTPVADDAARAVGLDDAVALPGDTLTTTPGEYSSGTSVGGYR